MHQEKIDSLTGVRGIAALWVIWFHAMGANSTWYLDNFLRRGYTGVDLFFILSGFVISYVYAKKMNTFSLDSAKSFIRKRFIRIYPCYLTILLIMLALVLSAKLITNIEFNESKFTPIGFLMQLFMLNGLGLPVDPHQWNFVSWTVGSEFAAYLLFPILVLYVPRLKPLASLVALCCIFALCFTGAWLVNDGAYYFLEKGLTLSRIFSEFLMGCLIYNIFIDQNYRKFFAKMLYPALLLLVATAFVRSEMITGVMVFSFCFILLGLASNPESLAAKALSTPFMKYLGEISYSTYLVQALVLTAISRVSTKISFLAEIFETSVVAYPLFNIVISCIVGAFFFKYVESYFAKKFR